MRRDVPPLHVSDRLFSMTYASERSNRCSPFSEALRLNEKRRVRRHREPRKQGGKDCEKACHVVRRLHPALAPEASSAGQARHCLLWRTHGTCAADARSKIELLALRRFGAGNLPAVGTVASGRQAKTTHGSTGMRCGRGSIWGSTYFPELGNRKSNPGRAIRRCKSGAKL